MKKKEERERDKLNGVSSINENTEIRNNEIDGEEDQVEE